MIDQDPAMLDLVTVAEIEAGVPLPLGHREPLQRLAAWIRAYLAAPHPDLGRPGNVCPYIPQALERDTVYVAVAQGDPAIPDVASRMLDTLTWFRETAANSGPDALYLTVVTIFPDLAAARIIDVIEGVQALLKPQFLQQGAMIGEFHPLPPARHGLWNPDFRPFACPFPALAMRQMVPADFPFVEDHDDHVRQYLERFADVVPAHLAMRVEERVESAGTDLLPVEATACPECGHPVESGHLAHADVVRPL